jgi:hypothetical protein
MATSRLVTATSNRVGAVLLTSVPSAKQSHTDPLSGSPTRSRPRTGSGYRRWAARRRVEEHRKAFRRTVKWRTGSEGRISYLKRGFGWKPHPNRRHRRCRGSGPDTAFSRTTWSGSAPSPHDRMPWRPLCFRTVGPHSRAPELNQPPSLVQVELAMLPDVSELERLMPDKLRTQ